MKAGLDELRQQVSVLTERLEASNVQMSRRVGALEAKANPGASSTPIGSRSAPRRRSNSHSWFSQRRLAWSSPDGGCTKLGRGQKTLPGRPWGLPAGQI